jgi:hypothetical protein
VLLIAVKNVRKRLPSDASELFEADEYYADKKRIAKIQHTKKLRWTSTSVISSVLLYQMGWLTFVVRKPRN